MLAQLLPSVFYSTVLSYFISDGGTTRFHHYTSMYDEYNLKLNPDIREDRSSFFDQLNSTYPTVMYMHGFLGNTSLGRQFCHATDIEYHSEVNCIIVDWTMTSHHANYLQVKKDLAQVNENFEFSFNQKIFLMFVFSVFPGCRNGGFIYV